MWDLWTPGPRRTPHPPCCTLLVPPTAACAHVPTVSTTAVTLHGCCPPCAHAGNPHYCAAGPQPHPGHPALGCAMQCCTAPEPGAKCKSQRREGEPGDSTCCCSQRSTAEQEPRSCNLALCGSHAAGELPVGQS